jgi:hypothetical protein
MDAGCWFSGSCRGGRWRMSLSSWGSAVPRDTSGGAAGESRERSGSTAARAGRIPARPRPPRRPSSGCWRCAGTGDWDRRLGPARIAGIVGLPASTVHRILTRHAMPKLAWPDHPTGRPVRYERARPGELVHVDIKKLGRLREGGGWRVHRRGSTVAAATRRPAHAESWSATSSRIPPSTTIPGWPTARYYQMSRPPPPWRSGPGRRPSSPPAESPCNGC